MTVHELPKNHCYGSNIITEEIMLDPVFGEDTTVWKVRKKKKKAFCFDTMQWETTMDP